jgi:hypothetical protein
LRIVFDEIQGAVAAPESDSTPDPAGAQARPAAPAASSDADELRRALRLLAERQARLKAS